MMSRMLFALLLALSAPLARADTLEALRADCRHSALTVDETVGSGFKACDPYLAAAGQSVADRVLAGLYMARINDRLTRLDARQLGDGQAMTDAQRMYSRPLVYLEESAAAAAGLDDQRWVVIELVTLLTSSSGIDVHRAAALLKQVHASPMAQRLGDGPEWAALQLAAAGSAELRRGPDVQAQRQQRLAAWPQVMQGLAQIADDDARALLQLRATRQLAGLHERDDAAAALQSLLSAWRQSLAIPSELAFTQLLLANTLDKHPALAQREIATVWSIVKESPEAAFKGRLIRTLAAVAQGCEQIQALDAAAQQYAVADGNDESSPATGLMLRALYGDVVGMRRELRGLECLSPDRLRALNESGMLSNVLDAVMQQARDDGELRKSVGQVRARLKAR